MALSRVHFLPLHVDRDTDRVAAAHPFWLCLPVVLPLPHRAPCRARERIFCSSHSQRVIVRQCLRCRVQRSPCDVVVIVERRRRRRRRRFQTE